MTHAITSAEFATALQKLGVPETAPKIAVAVSGGGDSLALALLMHDWTREKGGEMLALTVDHKLRPDSTQEAEAVQKLLRTRGIVHDILTWDGEKPSTHIQEKARDARYALLSQACRARGFPVLAVAHNAEDQIETFWMRLAHGSGLDGISGMAPRRETDGITLIRPVLSFLRERLRATCAHYGMEWIEDPSNKNEKYLRPKLRPFEKLLAEEGLTPQRLSQTLQKLEDAREALQTLSEWAAFTCLKFHPEGYAVLETGGWKVLPRDVQRRVIGFALSTVAPQVYPSGFEALEQTRLALLEPSFAGKTLSGCEIFPDKNDGFFISREASAVEKRIPARDGAVWDNRFILSGFGESLEAGALEENGLSVLRKNKELEAALESLPHKIKRTLPALWQGENLVAVPHVGYYSPDCPPHVKTGQIRFRVKIV